MKIVKMVDDKEEKMDEIVSFFLFVCVRTFCANILLVYSMNILHNEIYSFLASFTYAYQNKSIGAR